MWDQSVKNKRGSFRKGLLVETHRTHLQRRLLQAATYGDMNAEIALVRGALEVHLQISDVGCCCHHPLQQFAAGTLVSGHPIGRDYVDQARWTLGV